MNDCFPQFLLIILLFHVCRPIILTIKKFFPEFHRLFPKFKEIITNVVFFGNFLLKIFAHSKEKSVLKDSVLQKIFIFGKFCVSPFDNKK